MQDSPQESPKSDIADDDLPEMELTDADILDAMQHIPGYLDITTEDFREIYHLAHRHAIARLLGNFRAASLMRTGIDPVPHGMPLDEAAKALVRSGYKALPVVDETGHVIGMLTETDFLRRLKVDTFLELLLNMLDEGFEFKHRCHETLVSAAMTAPAVVLSPDARFRDVVSAFHKHDGRSIPIVDSDGRLLGLLLRKDFVAAYNLENIH